MAKWAERNRDPWGRSLVATLRRWWWLPAALSLLGALTGGIAGASAPKTAEAIVRVQTQSSDPQGTADAVQSAMLEASSREVFTAAAGAGGDVEALREKVDVAAIVKTTFLSIKATDRDPEVAAKLANDVAEAAVEASNKRIDDQLAELTRTTSVLIKGQKLPQADAEAQRVERLGGQLADSQGTLLMQSRRLTLLQSAQASDAEGPSTALMTLMGLIGGALGGVALALLLGGRRGAMSSADEMRRVYPELEIVRRHELDSVLALEADAVDRVVLTGVRAPAGAITALAEPVAHALRRTGREVTFTDDLSVLGRDEQRTRGITVVQTPMSPSLLRRVGRDSRALTVVLVRPGKTRFEWLDEHIDSFGDRVCVVVDG